MALQLRGEDIMTHGELLELLHGLEGEGPTSGVLQALYAGEEVHPADLHECLGIECRLNAKHEDAVEQIEGLMRRIEEHYPDEVPA
jgi:hypothetical protein